MKYIRKNPYLYGMETVIKKTETVKTYRVLGFTEEITSCDCCGREDLKGTLCLENIHTGTINYFGSVCGAKISGNTKKFITEELSAIEKENIEKARKEYYLTSEKKAYDQYMIDREPLLTINQSWEDRQPIIEKTFQLSEKARVIKEEICKKYFLKYSYKIN